MKRLWDLGAAAGAMKGAAPAAASGHAAAEPLRPIARLLLAIEGGGFVIVRRDGKPMTEADRSNIVRRIVEWLRVEASDGGAQPAPAPRTRGARPRAGNQWEPTKGELGAIARLMVAMEGGGFVIMRRDGAHRTEADGAKLWRLIGEWLRVEAQDDGDAPAAGKPARKRGAR